MELGSAALLSIDLQNEYRRDGPYPVEHYDRILANASTLISVCREFDVPVFHVQAWVEEEERKNYRLLNENLDDHLRSAIAGSEGADICVEVAPRQDETIIRKRWPSAFTETDLEIILKERGIEDLLVIGVWTDSCVRGSVFDAIYKGFRVWLVKDACGSATETMHRTGILDMANRLYGGGVFDTERAVNAIRTETNSAWRCTRPIEFPFTLATIDSFYDAL